MRTRVETGLRSWALSVHQADRAGFDQAYHCGASANPYRHPGLHAAYAGGYVRGKKLREGSYGASPSGLRQGSLKPPCASSNLAAPTTVLTRAEADTIRKLIDEAGSIMWHDADVDQAPWEHAVEVLTRKFAFILYNKRV